MIVLALFLSAIGAWVRPVAALGFGHGVALGIELRLLIFLVSRGDEVADYALRAPRALCQRIGQRIFDANSGVGHGSR